MADKKLSETENLSYDLSTPVYVAVVKYSSSEQSATVENRKIPLSDFAKASDLNNYATNTALTNEVNTLDAKFNNYPLDTAVVHNTGNETVAGNKSFTGTITATTQATSDNSTKVATTGYVKNNLSSYAGLNSPALTGNPTAPTQLVGDTSTKIANTQQVYNSITYRAQKKLNWGGAILLSPSSVIGNQLAIYTVPSNGEVFIQTKEGKDVSCQISIEDGPYEQNYTCNMQGNVYYNGWFINIGSLEAGQTFLAYTYSTKQVWFIPYSNR